MKKTFKEWLGKYLEKNLSELTEKYNELEERHISLLKRHVETLFIFAKKLEDIEESLGEETLTEWRKENDV